jgi:hypothetical protein
MTKTGLRPRFFLRQSKIQRIFWDKYVGTVYLRSARQPAYHLPQLAHCYQ